MGEIVGVKANVELVKKTIDADLALGERAIGNDFQFICDQYPDLTFLCTGFQIPEMKRQVIEDFGPHGVETRWYGRPLNAPEMTLTVKETLSGKAYQILKEIVREKKYVDITVGLTAESQPTSTEHTTWKMWNCVLSLDATDLSVDGDEVLKPSVTVNPNNVTPWDAEAPGTVSWE